MKFKEEVCGNCGFDLTTVEPVRVREVPTPDGDGTEMMFLAACPGCKDNRIVVAPEPVPAPEPPKPKASRRRAFEPEAEPESVAEPTPEPELAPEPEE